ncbi:type I secretion C-terminal target domain-containing protein, partial [Nitrincola tapanii]|uniref:type I secretion C-terminal target domain-containing protein n=1 Tax=Nitrincola tapanii TaxID=1708751 RepID=UPI001356A804
YVDPSEVTVGLTAASVEGAEFEDLVLGGPATVQISDTLDTVTATLTASTSEISEMGGSITYTITLSGGPGLIAPMDDLVFGLANGESITIYQGQTSGSYTRVYTEGDILGEPNITNSIESIVSGGDEYEDLKTKGTTQVGIDYGVIITGIGAENGDHLLYESSLKTGTSPNNSALSEQGSFTITALDGISELSIGDTLLTYDQLENLTDSNVVITTSYGTLTLNGYTGSESGGVVSYVYKLDEKVDNDSQLGATNTSYLDSFSVTVTDTDGDSSSANLRIKIVDDEPVLDIRNGFLANESGGILIGTLVNMGADVGSSSGATTTSSITWDGTVIAKIITGSGVETGVTLTSLGETVVITVSGNEITGKTATTNQTVFTITGQMDGTYTVNLVRPLDSSKLFQADGEILTYGDGPKAGYVLYEGNNLVAATGISAEDPNVLATFRATSGGNAANVNMSSNGLAVGANVIQSGDRVYIDVNDNKQFSALFLSLNQQYKSGNGKYIVHYTDGTHSGEQVIQTTNSSNDFFIQAKAGTFIDSVEIIGVSGNWKIDGLNFFTLDVDRTPSLDLAFTAEDSDGDTVSGQVVLTFDTSPTLVEGSLNNDAIGGGSGDNTLMGGEGDDILVGGAGNDTLWGGEGDDVFVWNLGDQGEAGSPAYDVVKDFGLGNNKLDLSDLLQDETVATLSDYLSFTVTAEGTLISVNHTGGVSGVTQEIFLEGIDLAQMAIDSGVSGADAQEQIISYLLDSGKLEIDQ